MKRSRRPTVLEDSKPRPGGENNPIVKLPPLVENEGGAGDLAVPRPWFGVDRDTRWKGGPPDAMEINPDGDLDMKAKMRRKARAY